jgi:dTDP-4-dehydrorhamnose 3,5-epimerase
MKFTETKISGVMIIEPKVFGDPRGFFMESYKKSVFVADGITEDFIQDNHSRSAKGVLRGLHFQLKPYGMGKLVRAIRGEIFDVAVDVRRNSPTFGQWVSEFLSEENKKMLYLPSGIAHGFLSLSEITEIYYKCTAEYNAQSERGLIWSDPAVGISWPKIGMAPILSERDKQNVLLKDLETNFDFGK